MNTDIFNQSKEILKPDLSRDCAIHIEHTISNVFARNGNALYDALDNCGSVESHPFWSMISTLTYLYGSGKISCEQLKKFYNDFCFFDDFSVSDFLSFDSNTGRIDGKLYEIEFETGEEALEEMEKAFRELCG